VRTVFLTIHDGHAASIILRSSTFEILKATPGLRIVILTPLIHDKRFVEEFQDENVFIEEMIEHQPNGAAALALRLARESFVRNTRVETFRLRMAAGAAVRSRSPFRRAAALGVKLLRHLPPGFWYRVADGFVQDDHTPRLFERYAPDLVVSMKAGLRLSEVPVLRQARRAGVPTAVIGLSWDNLTTKILPVRRVNRLIVWNEWMKRDAVSVQGFAEEQVRVSGVPHFDLYRDSSGRTSREAFFRRVGLDPAGGLILLATSSNQVSRECRMEELVEILYGAARAGAFGAPAEILVRLHPRDDPAAYQAFRGWPGLVVEKPFHAWTMGGRDEVSITREDFLHLADTLYHSDVLVNIFSTVMIEACVFDKPVVNVAFDGRSVQNYYVSARRFENYTHIRRFLSGGGVRVARTQAELVELVRFAFAHPEADREGRRRVVAENCYRVDGRSGERQARFLLECLERTGSRP
jgi:hypothetical protein